MSLRCLALVAVCVVFISTEAVSGEDVKKSVGDEVSFRPDKVVPSITSITWKHIKGVMVVKVIEWDDVDGVSIPNPRFKGITTLDEKTGQITITNLTVEHSGLYTMDINSREQEKRFSLTVTDRDVKKAVGETVSFRPDKLESPVTSITWKHRNNDGMVVKVIEWDVDDGFSIPNQRFQNITTLDAKTGQITITNLKVEHSGLYTININSREQEQRFTLTVTDGDVKKAVGGTVSFRPDKLGSPVTSFAWKQINGGMVVKAIEWDVDDGVYIPNPRFQGFTTLDEKTGQITITNLKVEHSGLYTIYINSREQQQRFSLTVMERVPKPVITIEKSSNPDVVYLRCNYSETIIWKNSTGNTLQDTKNNTPEFIKVTNTRNPGNFYTCTLKNDVSEETSDPVYERNLFVIEPVPKPNITIEKSNNTDVAYLRCGYSETIIWKNSTGNTLKGTKNHNPGEFITVKNTKNPENFYTCTLRNDVSEETSDPVYERDLFIALSKESNPGLIAVIVIGVLLLLIAIILIYLLVKLVHERVNKICPCIPNVFGPLDCLLKKEREPKESQLNDADYELLKTTASTSDEEPQ